MDKEMTAVKAARALQRMLDAFYRAVMAMVLGLLALVGIRPRGTGGGLARVVAEEMAAVAEEPRYELGEAVKARALQLRGMAPSETLIPLPAPIEEWLGTLSQADLKSVTGVPVDTLEQHVTSGEAGALGALGFVRSTAPAPARPAVDAASGGGKGKAGMAVDLGLDIDVADIVARFAPSSPVMRPR